ncbi:hypothetical protein K6Q96_06955 [Grimontia kaedaensis]|uniref:Uncharacterized protein n=1 Tax=Grimontia kaedaensis TaxID=2872157 RepID=A0ABY4WXM2_9GAMM|nr:hypothetical protein [Grimontia kaedaensis]USH03726.1 hypothetical protein K6Q96_06955 [Grimontia kaedaensis]
MKNRFSQADWESYRERLLPIISQTAKRNGHDHTQRIDDALSNKRAFLFLCPDGFVVLSLRGKQEKRRLLVLFAFGWGEHLIARYQPQIDDMARRAKAQKVELYTAVLGLSPLLEKQGYIRSQTNGHVGHWTKTL